jgi:ABC-type amino acid transport substrate-binding protein
MVVELLEGRIDAAAANRSVLVASLSHFPELKYEMELLGSGRNADLTKDQADAL